MSHEQKTSFNDDLARCIRDYQALNDELDSFAATVRYLVVVGLAAEYARLAAMQAVMSNPFLTVSRELMRP